jgi:hypothetical protein
VVTSYHESSGHESRIIIAEVLKEFTGDVYLAVNLTIALRHDPGNKGAVELVNFRFFELLGNAEHELPILVVSGYIPDRIVQP